MIFNDTSSLSAHLATRRSARPREMQAPFPDPGQLQAMIAQASRTPDHGKLAPWRFVIVPAESRNAFAAVLRKAFLTHNPDARPAQIEAAEQMAHYPASLIIALHSPKENAKIHGWEQELSTGAAIMNLLHAGHAAGFVGGWITGWAAYDEVVRAAFARTESERIAGFVYFGTPGPALEERDRPDLAQIMTVWTPAA